MLKSTFVGRYGERQSRCIDSEGRFASCSGLGSPRMGFLDAMRRPPGYRPGLGMNLPVVGAVSLPKNISFDLLPGAIGIGLGKIGPGVLGSILGRFITGGEGWTKVIVGGISGLTLLSEKWRRNSYLVGFALATLPDMVEPLIEGVMDAILPASAANKGARRLGFVTAAEQEALRRAQRGLLSSADGGGFVGRNIMLPGEYAALTQRVPLSGVHLNDTGLRNIA